MRLHIGFTFRSFQHFSECFFHAFVFVEQNNRHRVSHGSFLVDKTSVLRFWDTRQARSVYDVGAVFLDEVGAVRTRDSSSHVENDIALLDDFVFLIQLVPIQQTVRYRCSKGTMRFTDRSLRQFQHLLVAETLFPEGFAHDLELPHRVAGFCVVFRHVMVCHRQVEFVAFEAEVLFHLFREVIVELHFAALGKSIQFGHIWHDIAGLVFVSAEIVFVHPQLVQMWQERTIQYLLLDVGFVQVSDRQFLFLHIRRDSRCQTSSLAADGRFLQ